MKRKNSKIIQNIQNAKRIKCDIKITKTQLLRFNLNKHGLLNRHDTIDDSLFPLHATAHTSPYLSLLGRVKNFDWKDFQKKCSDYSYQLFRCMRGTLHLIPKKEVPIIFTLYGESTFKDFENFGITYEEANEIESHIIKAITKIGNASTISIKKHIDPNLVKKYKSKYGVHTNITSILKWMWIRGVLDYGAPNLEKKSDWRISHRTYRMNQLKPEKMNEDEALIALIKWYFDIYGPSTLDDFVWWSGKNKTNCKKAFEKIQKDLIPINVDGISDTLFIFSKYRKELENTPKEEIKNISRFLPYEDPIIKAYKKTRNRFIENNENKIITSGGEANPTVWLNGKIIGTWNWKNKKNQPINVELYEKINEEEMKCLHEEAEIVAKFLEASKIIWN